MVNNVPNEPLSEDLLREIETTRRRNQLEYEIGLMGDGSGNVDVGVTNYHWVRFYLGNGNYGIPQAVRREPGHEASLFIQNNLPCTLVKDLVDPDEWVIHSTTITNVSNDPSPLLNRGVQKIDSDILDATSSTININTAGFEGQKYELILTGRSTNIGTTDTLLLQFNSNTTAADYYVQYMSVSNAVETNSETIGTVASVITTPIPALSTYAGRMGSYHFHIHEPDNDLIFTNVEMTGGYCTSTTATPTTGTLYRVAAYGVWNVLDAVASIQIKTLSGQFAIGTSYTLYSYT